MQSFFLGALICRKKFSALNRIYNTCVSSYFYKNLGFRIWLNLSKNGSSDLKRVNPTYTIL